MFRKILITSALLATATVSNIATANAAPYIGGSTGIVVNTNDHTNFRGVPFNIYAGFGGLVDENWYLAGEVSGTVGTAKISGKKQSYTAVVNGAVLQVNYPQVKSTWGYGVSVLPGVVLSDHTVAYARLGVVRTHFSDWDKTQTGGQVGLGLQTTLTQNVDLRGEYDFVAYRSGGSFKGTPRQDAFNVGFVYKFD